MSKSSELHRALREQEAVKNKHLDDAYYNQQWLDQQPRPEETEQSNQQEQQHGN